MGRLDHGWPLEPWPPYIYHLSLFLSFFFFLGGDMAHANSRRLGHSYYVLEGRVYYRQ